MTKRVVWFVWVCALLWALGCEAHERHEGTPAVDSGRRVPVARDAGGRGSPPADPLPRLCASCTPPVMAGGDTTDFGTTPAPRCQEHQRSEVHMMTLAQAEAAGFDFADARAVALGRHELAVRWTDSAYPDPTHVDVELRTTGRVQVTTWVETTPDPRTATLPPCRPIPDHAALEVEVQLATADRAASGVFTDVLWFWPSNSDWTRGCGGGVSPATGLRCGASCRSRKTRPSLIT